MIDHAIRLVYSGRAGTGGAGWIDVGALEADRDQLPVLARELVQMAPRGRFKRSRPGSAARQAAMDRALEYDRALWALFRRYRRAKEAVQAAFAG